MATPTGAMRWYQTKRIPLWAVVGAGWGAAIYFLQNKGRTHPNVEFSSAARQDALAETQLSEKRLPGDPGRPSPDSPAKQKLRDSGLLTEGQTTDGIFPNTKMAEKVGEIKDKLLGDK